MIVTSYMVAPALPKNQDSRASRRAHALSFNIKNNYNLWPYALKEKASAECIVCVLYGSLSMNINQIDLVDECERGLLTISFVYIYRKCYRKPFCDFVKASSLAKPCARECFV